MPRSIDPDEVIAILRGIARPTAPYHEWRVLDAIRAQLERDGIRVQVDGFGQLHARVHAGVPHRAMVLAAHTDHPAFEVIDASGRSGRVRVLGGFRQTVFPSRVAVRVYDDRTGGGFAATLTRPEPAIDAMHNAVFSCHIDAERELSSGLFAVLDLPDVDVSGDEVRMAAADDLAGCALIIGTLLALRDEERPHDVRAIFTRAEETGLYGARLAAEDTLIPREAFVVSVEASRALPGAEAGRGIVVRAGDLHNTFSNEAERYLRVGREALAARGISTQRALLTGGTCEASAFVRLGWTATGVALPNVNYHNAAPDGGFAPEIVRLSDLLGGIALAAEASLAAGADAEEAWWPDVRVVPKEIRDLLGRDRHG